MLDNAAFASPIASRSARDLQAGLDAWLAAPVSDERERWALEYLREYCKTGRISQRVLERAIRCCHRPTELQGFLYSLLQHDFQARHAKTISAFEQPIGGTELLILHLSCEPRVHLARESAQTFVESAPLVRNLIVIGREDAEQDSYEFEPEHRILTVPAPDSYEGLSRKVSAAYKFLSFSGFAGCVLKVDDDIRCIPSHFDARLLSGLVTQNQYVGRVIDTRQVGLYRWWHLGKCSDTKLNREPYSMIAHVTYAEGPAYAVGPRALTVLAKSAVYYSQQLEVEGGYEDVAVGKILNSCGIYPHNFDLRANGLVYSTDDAPEAVTTGGGPEAGAKKVSVIVTTYNHELFIRQALDGILMQKTAFDFDVIVSEDCSTDATQAILLEYQSRYPDRITLMLSERNLNTNHVTRRAIEAAQGEYLAFMDGDDYWTSPEKLQRQVEFLDSHSDSALCFHAIEQVDSEGHLISGAWPTPAVRPEFSPIEDLIQENFIGGCSALIRRSAIGTLPSWFEKAPFGDWALYVLAARSGLIGFIPDAFGVYRRHATGYWNSLSVEQKRATCLACLDVMQQNLGSDLRDAFQRSRIGWINRPADKM
jgi:glycosyltransferase involved in cell wall biosynthesis